MYHPSRGGVRGGQDQFDWEDVKADKYRENYLGHSVKAPVGRWQKGKDLHWYTRSGKVDPTVSKQQEKDALKKMEAEALALALGKGNAKKKAGGVSKQELAEVCRKGQLERDSMDIERVEGMGFGSSRARLMDVATAPVKETLGATGTQEVRLEQASRTNEKLEDERLAGEGHSKDKMKKKEKKEKKSKKEKKHKKKEHDDDISSKEYKRRKRRHDHDEIDKNDHKSSKHERKRTHNHDKRETNFKHRRRDSTESESSGEKGKYSRKHHSPSDEDNCRNAFGVEERPKERRQRHDTE